MELCLSCTNPLIKHMPFFAVLSELWVIILCISEKKTVSSTKWQPSCIKLNVLTHWGRVTHICISKLTIIDSGNGLSPSRHQAIIQTSAGISLIGPFGTNISEILINFYTFSLKKMHLKMLSGKCQPSCLGLDVLMRNHIPTIQGDCTEIKNKKWWYLENCCGLDTGLAC